MGTRLIPKLREGCEHTIGLDIRVTCRPEQAAHFPSDLKLILEDLGLESTIRIEPADVTCPDSEQPTG